MFTNIKLLGLEVDKGPTLPKKFSLFRSCDRTIAHFVHHD